MDRRALSIRAGLLAPPIAVAGVVLAALVDPSFSVANASLSQAGELPAGASGWLTAGIEHPHVLLFNGSLVVAGLLGVPFSWVLYGDARHPLERSGATSLTLAFLALLAVGSFPQPSGLHVPALIVFVLSTAAFLWIYGAGSIQRGRVRFGAVTVGLGALLVGGWLGWDALFPDAGMAVPEFLGIALLSSWTFSAATAELRSAEGRSPVEALRSTVDAVRTGGVE